MAKYWVHIRYDYEIETDNISEALANYEFPSFEPYATDEFLVDYRLESGEIKETPATFQEVKE